MKKIGLIISAVLYIGFSGTKNPSQAKAFNFNCDCSINYKFKMSQGGVYDSSQDIMRFVGVPINCGMGVHYALGFDFDDDGGWEMAFTDDDNIFEISPAWHLMPLGTHAVTLVYTIYDAQGEVCMSSGTTQYITLN